MLLFRCYVLFLDVNYFTYRCYSVADMPWYQRKIASTIFGADIPTSTYEEALEYFREAESMQPLFYR